MVKNKKLRLIYALLFAAVLVIEILIGAFVRDRFIRPFVGDVLVVVLICFFARIFLPTKPKLLPLFCTLFAFCVELMQLFDIVSLLGLEQNSLLGIIIGSTFDLADLVCYAAGGIIAFAVQWLISKFVLQTEQ